MKRNLFFNLIFVLLAFIAFVFVSQISFAAPHITSPCPKDPSLEWNNCFGTKADSQGSKYTGDWRHNKKDGIGLEITSTRKLLKGLWPKGKLVLGEFSTLTKCKGKYNKATWTHCVGEYSFWPGYLELTSKADKLKYAGSYTGEFKNGQPHGRGIYLSRSREYFDDWKDGKIEGQGFEYFRIGGLDWGQYEGGFKNWLYHGYGVLEPLNKDPAYAFADIVYKGQWREGDECPCCKTQFDSPKCMEK